MSEEVDIDNCMDMLTTCLCNLKRIVREVELVSDSVRLKADVFDIEHSVEKMASHLEDLTVEEK